MSFFTLSHTSRIIHTHVSVIDFHRLAQCLKVTLCVTCVRMSFLLKAVWYLSDYLLEHWGKPGFTDIPPMSSTTKPVRCFTCWYQFTKLIKEPLVLNFFHPLHFWHVIAYIHIEVIYIFVRLQAKCLNSQCFSDLVYNMQSEYVSCKIWRKLKAILP